MCKGDSRDVWKGVVAGLVAGAAASWVMNQSQAGLSKMAGRLNKDSETDSEEEDSSSEQEYGSREESQFESEESAPATVKAASAVSEKLLKHSLTDREKQMAGPAVHYGFGAVVAGLYGATAEAWPAVGALAGVPFGIALWAAADEIAVPALKLSGPPSQYPVSTHAQALSAHVVYGVTTEILRRALRRLLG